MKRLFKILLSFILTFSLVACSNDSDKSDEATVKDYIDTYEVLSYVQTDKGMVFILDDGSEYGLGMAVKMSDDQFNRIYELDFFSETYEEDLYKIAEESKEFKLNILDTLVPNLSNYDQYIGQKLEVLMNNGYYVSGHNISDNYTSFTLYDANYGFDIEVAEKVDVLKAEDLTDEDIKNFTIVSFRFVGWTSDFLNTLY